LRKEPPDYKSSGAGLGLEDDLKIKRALSVTTNITFYRYEINFNLFEG